MAAVEMQGDTWTVRYRQNGVRKRYTLPAGSSKRDAERQARKIQHAIDNGEPWEQRGRADKSLHDLVSEYKAHQREAGRSAATLRGYGILDRLVEYAAGRAKIAPIDSLTRRTVRAFLVQKIKPELDAKNMAKVAKYEASKARHANYEQELAEHEAGRRTRRPRRVKLPVPPRITAPGNTIDAYWRIIKAWWTWALDEYEDDDDVKLKAPPRKAALKLPTVIIPQVVAPSWSEIDSMIEELDPSTEKHGRNKDVSALWRTLLIQRYTGLRVSQASGLRWCDLARELLEDGTDHGPAVNIGPALAKTQQEAEQNRWIPVPRRLMRHLSEWRLADGMPDDSTNLIVGNAEHDPDSGRLVAGVPRDPAEAVGEAWARAGIDPKKWQGHPTHAIRKRVRTHLERQLLGGDVEIKDDKQGQGRLVDRAINHQMGHAREGVAAKNYIDPYVYLPALRRAMEMIPTPEEVAERVAELEKRRSNG